MHQRRATKMKRGNLQDHDHIGGGRTDWPVPVHALVLPASELALCVIHFFINSVKMRILWAST